MKNTSPTSSAVARLCLAAACLALLVQSACASVGPVVKVGLVAPFEGRDRAIGYDAIYSARLAVREINAAGGINGTRVALVALDDSGDRTLAGQAAATLGIDPGVVAVVGHYLPETTAAAAPVYDRDGLALLVMGEPPFAASDPAARPAAFRRAYEAVSPFDEAPGPYAGPTYDAFSLLWSALAQAERTGGISRAAVREALSGIEYEGLSQDGESP
jgi:branched-chain amino acid transport system substrate-binding protein